MSQDQNPFGEGGFDFIALLQQAQQMPPSTAPSATASSR